MKSVSEKKSRGPRTSKIVKSKQSYSNGLLPYHCSFYYLARALDAWDGMSICVSSKDAQKKLARTSLNRERQCNIYSLSIGSKDIRNRRQMWCTSSLHVELCTLSSLRSTSSDETPIQLQIRIFSERDASQADQKHQKDWSWQKETLSSIYPAILGVDIVSLKVNFSNGILSSMKKKISAVPESRSLFAALK